MLTKNDIQRDLLQKFDELCKKANVKYVLHGHAAFLAYNNQPFEEINTLEVLMCQGDAEKVSDILDDDAYYFEDFRSNPKFDRSFMMFGFKNSLDVKRKELNFLTTRYIDNQCIRIFIHFIEQPLSKINGKLLVNNRKILKFKYMDKDYEYRNFKTKRKFVNNVFKVVSDDFYNKRIYNLKKKAVSINTWDDIKKYPLIKITGKRRVESDLFDTINQVDFDGISSYIIGDFERYAEHYYGKNWRDKKWPGINRLSSALISWEEFSKDPEVIKCVDEIQKRYDIIYQKQASVSDSRTAVKNMKNQIKMSKSVIYTREDMLEQKDKIMELYQTENMEELGTVLEPLIRSLSIGINRGYTYSVDEDIDNVLDSYLRKTNETELANEIKKYKVDI